MKTMHAKTKSKLLSWGIILALNGVNLVAIIKYLTQTNLLLGTSIIMVVTTMLLLLSGSLNELRFWRIDPVAIAIILYGVCTVAAALVSDIGIGSTPGGAIYQGYCLLTVILLWNRSEHINRYHLMKMTFYANGILGLFSLAVIFKNAQESGMLFGANFYNQAGDILFSRDTNATIGFMAFIAVLSFQSRTSVEKLVKTIFLVSSIGVMILSNRRTIIINAFLVFVMHLRNTREMKHSISLKEIHRIEAFFVLILLGVGIYHTVPVVHNVLERSVNSLASGLLTFSGQTATDQSSLIRFNLRQKLLEEFRSNTSVSQMLFGHGYMDAWIDFPYLQAFWELGLVGGLVFLYLQLIIPIKQLLPKQSDPCNRYAQYLVSNRIILNFASGTCYGVFFSVLLAIALQKKTHEQGREGK